MATSRMSANDNPESGIESSHLQCSMPRRAHLNEYQMIPNDIERGCAERNAFMPQSFGDLFDATGFANYDLTSHPQHGYPASRGKMPSLRDSGNFEDSWMHDSAKSSNEPFRFSHWSCE